MTDEQRELGVALIRIKIMMERLLDDMFRHPEEYVDTLPTVQYVKERVFNILSEVEMTQVERRAFIDEEIRLIMKNLNDERP